MDDERIAEIFESLGPVTIRRMFGGKGIYHRGLILALVVRGELLLKADAVSAPEFEATGATRWAPQGKHGPVNMPYWSIPDEAIDDPDQLARWTRKAWEAALRAQDQV